MEILPLTWGRFTTDGAGYWFSGIGCLWKLYKIMALQILKALVVIAGNLLSPATQSFKARERYSRR
jgi:hypothetical protein